MKDECYNMQVLFLCLYTVADNNSNNINTNNINRCCCKAFTVRVWDVKCKPNHLFWVN